MHQTILISGNVEIEGYFKEIFFFLLDYKHLFIIGFQSYLLFYIVLNQYNQQNMCKVIYNVHWHLRLEKE